MTTSAPKLSNPIEALGYFYDEHSPMWEFINDGVEFHCPRCETAWPCRGQRAARALHDALFPEP